MEWKNIRIFISSTFNDMHAERDYLVKYVFPGLREWCETRKLHLIDIDLRWGVSAEDAQNNQTVYACLRNIDESRPFFLCFLGQRRGWVPDRKDISEETGNSYPEITSRIGRYSVTELEIEHALLAPMLRIEKNIRSKPQAVEHALFFFRDEGYVGQLSDAQRMIFTNDADPDPGASDALLENFKRSVSSRWDKTYSYSGTWDPDVSSPELAFISDDVCRGRLTNFRCEGESLADFITEQLKKEIEKEYPDHVPSGTVNAQEADLEQQMFFAEQSSQGYIERQGDFEDLEVFLEADWLRLLLIEAPAGQGKTSLLAHYSEYLKKQAGVRVFIRFCGASDLCSTIYGVWSSILSEAGLIPPSSEDMLINSMDRMLSAMQEKGRKTVIILDAVNQLPDGLAMFRWFPREIPEGIKIIFSVKRDRDTEDLLRRLLEEETMLFSSIRPFGTQEDKAAVINEYLKTYLKKLDDSCIEEICALPASSNPLYLKVLLSELRVFGSFRRLSEEIKKFGKDAAEAFCAVLERMEQDTALSPAGSADSVRTVFGLMAASRYGLSEKEMTALLKRLFPDADERDLAENMQVCLRQIRSFLTRREGRWDFFYESFRIAAERRYEKQLPHLHGILAGYFAGITASDHTDEEGSSPSGDLKRALGELGYHTYMAGCTDAVPDAACEALLTDADYLRRKNNVIGPEALLADYLRIPEEKSPERLVYLRRALRLSLHVTAEHPEEFCAQLLGRMAQIEDEKIRTLLKNLLEHEKNTSLIPLTQALPGPMDAKVISLAALEGSVSDAAVIGETLCTGDSKGNLRIWDMESWKCLRTFSAHDQKEFHFVKGVPDLITWARIDNVTVLKHWDIFSGMLRDTARTDHLFDRTRTVNDLIVGGSGVHDFVACDAWRISDLARVELDDELREKAKQAGDDVENEHPLYDLQINGTVTDIFRKGAAEEKRNELPVCALAVLEDGSFAGGGTYEHKEKKGIGEELKSLFRYTVYAPDGSVRAVIPVCVPGYLASCEGRMVYSSREDGFLVDERKIFVCGAGEPDRPEMVITPSVTFPREGNGKSRTEVVGFAGLYSSPVRAVSHIGDNYFVANTYGRSFGVKGTDGTSQWLEYRHFHKMNYHYTFFAYGGEFASLESGYVDIGPVIGGISLKHEPKTVFRRYDARTFKLLSEEELPVCADGIVMSGKYAVLICEGADKNGYPNTKRGYLSVRDLSLKKEFWRKDLNIEYLLPRHWASEAQPTFLGKEAPESLERIAHPENAVIFVRNYLLAAEGQRILIFHLEDGTAAGAFCTEDQSFLSLAAYEDTVFAGTTAGKILRFRFHEGKDFSEKKEDSENPEIAAARERYRHFGLDPDNESAIERILLTHPDVEKRLAAVQLVSDENTLKTAARMDDLEGVRLAAVKRITDQIFLLNIAREDASEKVRLAAVSSVTDQILLADYLKRAMRESAPDKDVIYKAIGYCTDDSVLYKIARGEYSDENLFRNHAASMLNGRDYRYALSSDINNYTRGSMLLFLINEFREDALFVARVLLTDPDDENRYYMALCCNDEKLLMREWILNAAGRENISKELKRVGSGFPEAYEQMTADEKMNFRTECRRHAELIAEEILAEDKAVRSRLPADVPVYSKRLYRYLNTGPSPQSKQPETASEAESEPRQNQSGTVEKEKKKTNLLDMLKRIFRE